MWIGEHEVDIHTVVDGKQLNSVLYLDRIVRGDGGSSNELQCGCKQTTRMEDGYIVGETAKGEMCGTHA